MRLFGKEKLGELAVSPTDLSRTQQVSRNTISAHLRALEEQGLIEREVDREDLRQFRIRLTTSGRALIESTMPSYLAFLDDLAGDLTPDEREQLRTLLRKLHGSLCVHGQIEGCSAWKTAAANSDEVGGSE